MTKLRNSLQRGNGSNAFIVGIDATNLRQGGGVTHLIELLRAADPIQQGVSKVIVWGSSQTLMLIDNKPWLEKINPRLLNKNLLWRSFWQRFILSSAAKKYGCNLLFVPGGSFSGNFSPIVSMSQNLLPFQFSELKRYGYTWLSLKLILLRIIQVKTFRSSAGIIFLSNFAKETVKKVTGQIKGLDTIIPHGLNYRFMMAPRPQKAITTYSNDEPYRILYVSTIDQYKHQWHVVEAVSMLRRTTGWPLLLELVGTAYPPAKKKLDASIERFDPYKNWVKYDGLAPYEKIHSLYKGADLVVFASSCENMPNILLESMAAGLPISSSACGPMPEMLGQAGTYFDPENPISISEAILKLIQEPNSRSKFAALAFEQSKTYSWQKCARDTFAYLLTIGRLSDEGY